MRLGTGILLALAKLYARAMGLEEVATCLVLPLAFLEYYAEAKRAEREKAGASARAGG